MEEKQEKKQNPEFKGNLGFIWLTGILVILLGCTVVYTLKITKDNNELKQEQQRQAFQIREINNQYTAQQSNNTTSNEITETQSNEDTKEKAVTKEMSSDEKYKIFAKNLKKAVSKYDSKEKNANVMGSSGDFPFEIELLSNGNLSIEFYDKKTNKKYGTKTLAKNVLAVNVVEEGNGGYRTPYFICEDGTVGRANVDESILNKEKKIKVEYKINKLKNIVSIVSGGGGFAMSGACNPIFIDIDGKIYE